MRILFVTEGDVSPLQGGTEHITVTISSALMKLGHFCALAYCRPCPVSPVAVFDQKHQISQDDYRQDIREYVRSGGFDAIISNLVDIKYKRRLLPELYLSCAGRGTVLLACYHAMPGEELIGNTPACSLWRIRHGGALAPNLKDAAIRVCPQSLLRLLFRGRLRRKYRLMYDHCDRLVLLSKGFFEPFAALAGVDVDEKFVELHSALSYNEFLPEEEIPLKNKEVLIVSRLEERAKRLSRALRIWRSIEREVGFEDWKLTIVGTGPDAEYYKAMASRLGLRRVSFEGRQEDLLPYYRRASVFLMTSAYEGWGLTLTESQQMGVVPVVYKSYRSVTDIIDDGINGVLVRDGDQASYIRGLKALMADTDRRCKMAAHAISSSHRFETGTIVRRLLDIIAQDDSRP